MVQVQTFGSFANGLGMHSSDLDLVVTGLMEPDSPQTGGALQTLLTLHMLILSGTHRKFLIWD